MFHSAFSVHGRSDYYVVEIEVAAATVVVEASERMKEFIQVEKRPGEFQWDITTQ